MRMRTSPEAAKGSSCSAYTDAGPSSFTSALYRGMLSVRAITLKRFFPGDAVHLVRSQAKWLAVDAEPPLPAMNTVREFRQAWKRASMARDRGSRGSLRRTFSMSLRNSLM